MNGKMICNTGPLIALLMIDRIDILVLIRIPLLDNSRELAVKLTIREI
ncbi:MAG: hypothetical protein JRG74_10475 [Deltaproteobacteria bacterium]|nr:hypothetical protein [Deltaproteobacteria bacterium]MBW1834959.1 hypothetical protein [Deltaproteobacteria bacterium]MBW2166487.1 hypothetical protein [Deltaproteobacteria bacterium]